MRFLPTGHSIMVMVEGIICIVEHMLCVYFYCNIQVRGLLGAIENWRLSKVWLVVSIMT